jgi:hypothetical protein
MKRSLATTAPVRSTSARPGAIDFKGNKQSLPQKPCVACGRAMTWRKRWAKNWNDVKYCSNACRDRRGESG